MQHFLDGESFLEHAHALFPAQTPKWFDRPTTSGRTSYERLAAIVTQTPAHVVDLGCGDGALCELLLKKFPQGLRLTGIDISAAELAAAKVRLSGSDARLLQERAQRLSLPDASVDYVLCHMALMLMSRLAEVLQEVARVLKLGGQFAAVVGRGWKPGPTQEYFRESFRQALGEFGGTPFGTLGDDRTRTRDGLAAAFATNGSFQKPTFEDLDLTFRLPPSELADFMMGAYDTVVLPQEGRQWMRQRLAQRFSGLAESDGRVPYGVGLRLVAVSR